MPVGEKFDLGFGFCQITTEVSSDEVDAPLLFVENLSHPACCDKTRVWTEDLKIS